MFYSIVLLNTLGKLIEKVISKRIQIYLIINNSIYMNQLRGLKQCSFVDTGLYLILLQSIPHVHNVVAS